MAPKRLVQHLGAAARQIEPSVFVIIDNTIFEAEPPPQYIEGYVLNQIESQLMNAMWLDTYQSNIDKWAETHPDATPEELTSAYHEIAKTTQIKLTSTFDPVQTEAILIASEKIATALAAEGLPPPPNLTLHATELANNDKTIRHIAHTRVEARLRAGIIAAAK